MNPIALLIFALWVSAITVPALTERLFPGRDDDVFSKANLPTVPEN